MKVNRESVKRVAVGLHRFATRFGVHILPVHYSSPLSNLLDLERTRYRWAKKSEMPGVAADLDAQGARLRAICVPFQSEYSGNKIYLEAAAECYGPGFGYIEAQALHGFVRHFKPKRIVEVGGGVSTFCMARACEMNYRETGQNARLFSVEPYPSMQLKNLAQVELIPHPVQEVPLDIFTALGQGDILFIDSSHTVKPGGDVNYLVLEVLPRLQKGTIVHFHDIFLPYDYQRDLLQTFYHWSETSLLHAFLINNARARIVVCLSLLHYERPDLLREVFPEYRPQPDENGLVFVDPRSVRVAPDHFPSSTYLEVLD